MIHKKWLIVFLISDIPLAVSFPHFYKSDPSLANNIEGLDPSAEKHETEIVIQPVSNNSPLL